MFHRNATLRACAIGFLTFGLALLALWSTGSFPPVALANSGGSVTYYTLTLQFQGTGSVNLNPPNVTYASATTRSYAKGTEVTLTASAPAGWFFDRWEGSNAGDNDVKSITMNANKTMKAVFVQYRLTVLHQGDGPVHVTPPDVTRWPHFKEIYTSPTTVTLTALPMEDWAFTGWTGDKTSDALTVTILVDGDRTVYANFEQAWLFIQIAGHGSVNRSPNGEPLSNSVKAYALGAHVTFTAKPDPGWIFNGWTGDLTGTVNPGSLDMLANKDVTATFVADATPPVITLTGAATVYTQCGGTYSDPGATALDNADGDITSEIVTTGRPGTPSAPGTYAVAYNVTDQGGNAATQVTRTVIVEDTTRPVITLLGGNPVVVYRGTPYSDGGATATDTCDGDQTGAIVVGGDTVDTNTIGEYTLTYDVSDTANNHAVRRTRTVLVTDPPSPTVSFQSASSTVLESGGTATIPVTVSNYQGASWSVTYSLSGSATPQTDYTAPGNTINASGTGNAAIEIPVLDDALAEGAETVVVTLLQASGAGLAAPTVHTLTIQDDEGLTASFTADPITGSAPLEVSFTDTSTSGAGTITGWQWDFGDGTGSTAQHPVHTYTDAGSYTVSLTVATESDNDLAIREGYINVGGDGSLISVAPSLLQFGYVAVGQSKTLPVTIRNEGEDLLVGTATVEAPFSIDGNASYAIEPGDDAVLTIEYAPTAALNSEDVIGFVGGGNAQVAVYGSGIAPASGPTAGVRLNELVVWNTSGVLSANGEYVDWIELYNDNSVAMDISGWSLTDDDTDPTKYVIPAGTIIGPKSYLIIFASIDTSPAAGELHTGFTLDEVNGGYLGLFAPSSGARILVSDVNYPAAVSPSKSFSLLDGENKSLGIGFAWGMPTPFGTNFDVKVWEFTVFASPGIVQGQQLPDPEIPYQWFSEGEPSSYLFLEDWLSNVQTYANKIVRENNQGDIITAPVTDIAATVDADVATSAEAVFLNKRNVQAINGMDESFNDEIDLYQTARSVPNGSVVLIRQMTTVVEGEPLPLVIDGQVLFTKRDVGFGVYEYKSIMVLAVETSVTNPPALWHAQVFAHEWGHYAGIAGHPKTSNDELRIMARNSYYHITNTIEPWFFVTMIQEERAFYEGTLWGSFMQRRRVPPLISGYDVYVNPGADQAIQESDFFKQGSVINAVPPW